MDQVMKSALQSAGKKVLRTLVAVSLTAAAVALPAVTEVFKQAAASGSTAEHLVFGSIVAVLVGISAFVERHIAKPKA